MSQPQPEIQVFDIDHLGTIVGIIDEFGLVAEQMALPYTVQVTPRHDQHTQQIGPNPEILVRLCAG